MIKKWVLFLIAFASAALVAEAAVQPGHVKTRGRLGDNGEVIHGQFLEGVSVVLGGANSTVSDSKGEFSLTLPSSHYFLQKVNKKGYVLVDSDILSKQYAISPNPLVIVMESLSQLEADKLKYRRQIQRTFDRQLQVKQAEIDSLLACSRITEEQYVEEIRRLTSDLDKNEKLVVEMAERYAKIDFDEMDEFRQKVAEYILGGDLVRADSLLNTRGSMSERSARLDREKKAIEDENDELTKRKVNLDKATENYSKELNEFASDCYSRFEICKIRHENDSAAYWLGLRADKDPSNAAWQMDAGQFIKTYLADYDKALNYYNTALEKVTEENEKAMVLHSISGLYLGKNDFEKARDAAEQAFNIVERMYGPDHFYTADSYNNLGAFYSETGDYVRSLEFLNKALKIREKVYGVNSHETSRTLGNMATVYSHLNDYESALSYNRKALEIRQAVLDEDDPLLALSYNNIASVYSELDNYDLALEYFSKALDIRKRIYGDIHPEIATTYHNVALLYYSMAEYDKALQYNEQALDIYRNVFGEEHIRVALSYNSLGGAYKMQGNYLKAVETYLKALRIFSSLLNDRHDYVALTYNNLGTVYSDLDRVDEALECYSKALAIELSKGEESRAAAVYYNNIGVILERKSNFSAAVEYYKKALEIHEKIYGPNHSNLITGYNNLGVNCYKMGLYDEALEYFDKMAKIIVEKYGNRHPDNALVYNNMASVYNIKRDHSKALDYQFKSLDILMEKHGENHLEVARLYNNIGNTLHLMGKDEKALEFIKKSLGIREQTLGSEHSEVAGSYDNLGVIYAGVGNFEQALESYQKSLSIYQKNSQANLPDIARIYNNMGNVYHDQGNSMAELNCLKKALELRESIFGKEHVLTKQSMAMVYIGYMQMAKEDKNYLSQAKDFMADKIIVASINGGDTPASRQNMSGEYFLLEYNDWNLKKEDNVYSIMEQNKSEPINLTVMKEGEVSTHYFEDKIGCLFVVKYIDKEEKAEVFRKYDEWKSSRKEQ